MFSPYLIMFLLWMPRVWPSDGVGSIKDKNSTVIENIPLPVRNSYNNNDQLTPLYIQFEIVVKHVNDREPNSQTYSPTKFLNWLKNKNKSITTVGIEKINNLISKDGKFTSKCCRRSIVVANYSNKYITVSLNEKSVKFDIQLVGLSKASKGAKFRDEYRNKDGDSIENNTSRLSDDNNSSLKSNVPCSTIKNRKRSEIYPYTLSKERSAIEIFRLSFAVFGICLALFADVTFLTATLHLNGINYSHNNKIWLLNLGITNLAMTVLVPLLSVILYIYVTTSKFQLLYPPPNGQNNLFVRDEFRVDNVSWQAIIEKQGPRENCYKQRTTKPPKLPIFINYEIVLRNVLTAVQRTNSKTNDILKISNVKGIGPMVQKDLIIEELNSKNASIFSNADYDQITMPDQFSSTRSEEYDITSEDCDDEGSMICETYWMHEDGNTTVLSSPVRVEDPLKQNLTILRAEIKLINHSLLSFTITYNPKKSITHNPNKQLLHKSILEISNNNKNNNNSLKILLQIDNKFRHSIIGETRVLNDKSQQQLETLPLTVSGTQKMAKTPLPTSTPLGGNFFFEVKVICRLQLIVFLICLNVSLHTIALLALDRFLFIFQAIRYHAIMTRWTSYTILIVIWILNIVMTVVPFTQQDKILPPQQLPSSPPPSIPEATHFNQIIMRKNPPYNTSFPYATRNLETMTVSTVLRENVPCYCCFFGTIVQTRIKKQRFEIYGDFESPEDSLMSNGFDIIVNLLGSNKETGESTVRFNQNTRPWVSVFLLKIYLIIGLTLPLIIVILANFLVLRASHNQRVKIRALSQTLVNNFNVKKNLNNRKDIMVVSNRNKNLGPVVVPELKRTTRYTCNLDLPESPVLQKSRSSCTSYQNMIRSNVDLIKRRLSSFTAEMLLSHLIRSASEIVVPKKSISLLQTHTNVNSMIEDFQGIPNTGGFGETYTPMACLTPVSANRETFEFLPRNSNIPTRSSRGAAKPRKIVIAMLIINFTWIPLYVMVFLLKPHEIPSTTGTSTSTIALSSEELLYSFGNNNGSIPHMQRLNRLLLLPHSFKNTTLNFEEWCTNVTLNNDDSSTILWKKHTNSSVLGINPVCSTYGSQRYKLINAIKWPPANQINNITKLDKINLFPNVTNQLIQLKNIDAVNNNHLISPNRDHNRDDDISAWFSQKSPLPTTAASQIFPESTKNIIYLLYWWGCFGQSILNLLAQYLISRNFGSVVRRKIILPITFNVVRFSELGIYGIVYLPILTLSACILNSIISAASHLSHIGGHGSDHDIANINNNSNDHSLLGKLKSRVIIVNEIRRKVKQRLKMLLRLNNLTDLEFFEDENDPPPLQHSIQQLSPETNGNLISCNNCNLLSPGIGANHLKMSQNSSPLRYERTINLHPSNQPAAANGLKVSPPGIRLNASKLSLLRSFCRRSRSFSSGNPSACIPISPNRHSKF